ncbi:uncharacterized protein LOC132698040 [Cylas formicarius]|uniref:uncharacterized protein LOC132698040 n=1 Tax=Cylas formicarius TaxID=197179 RepID=UPI0029583911|nr:uncharacterized protein LOC132698040 [Cylas formicarius]
MESISAKNVNKLIGTHEPPKPITNASNKRPNDVKLQDIEEQLEKAENRCNTLKNQLDSMKERYGVSRRSKESNVIGTDTSGAAVRTINNILNGIAKSVNRLSEIATPRPQDLVPAPTIDVRVSNREASRQPEPVANRKARRRKCRGQKTTSSRHLITKQSEKRTQSLEQRSSAFLRKRYFNKARGGNLIEIYHNEAVKHSDSDESHAKKSRQRDEVPPLDVAVDQERCRYETPEAPRTVVSCYSRNYELPTVASRMKQVAKSYLSTLNFKTIPFCAAISTTQSHNIGINIQQVMNIIKNRQPINGISPTLAHNIGLAAEKMNSKPFSALVSTINSKLGTTASRCPLSRTYLNLQQLQEQAKHVPQDIIDEVDEEEIESPEMNIITVTGPSGDMEIKNKKVPNWSVDKNASTERCTCVAQPCVDLQRLAVKHRRLSHANTVSDALQVAEPTTLKGAHIKTREKNLKEVLSNLHRDFATLNNKYEQLAAKTSHHDTSGELEKLEGELSKKEEEITMVMTLCKEVMALKQQIKQLKEKRSRTSVVARSKFKEYNNPEAAFHLTKLLKQIQRYQMRYKTNFSDE